MIFQIGMQGRYLKSFLQLQAGRNRNMAFLYASGIIVSMFPIRQKKGAPLATGSFLYLIHHLLRNAGHSLRRLLHHGKTRGEFFKERVEIGLDLLIERLFLADRLENVFSGSAQVRQ